MVAKKLAKTAVMKTNEVCIVLVLYQLGIRATTTANKKTSDEPSAGKLESSWRWRKGRRER